VRGQGLALGVELEPDRADQGAGIFRRLLKDGFIVDYQPHAATFRLFPPYIISIKEMDRFLAAFEGANQEAMLRQEGK
jgi:4-aminobutyrate aminotransferase-like enzyme